MQFFLRVPTNNKALEIRRPPSIMPHRIGIYTVNAARERHNQLSGQKGTAQVDRPGYYTAPTAKYQLPVGIGD